MMRIADGVYSIGQRGGFESYASGRVHAYLLDDGEGLTLVDTLYETHPQLIIEQLVRMNRTLSDLKRILLTHGHRSHLGGLRFLRDQSGAEVYAHEYEADIVAGKRPAQPVTLRPVPPLSTYPQRLGLALPAISKHPPCPVDHHLEDGQQVGPVEVVGTPGHTPGHLSFYWEERGALFTGDAIATWPEFGPGWPGFNLDPEEHRKSVLKLTNLQDVEVLAVSHGEPLLKGVKARLNSLAERLVSVRS